MAYKFNMLYFYRCILFSILITFILTSCGLNMFVHKVGDGGLLSGKPCPAPCFLGIVPGKTTEDKAISLLRKQGISKYQEVNKIISYDNSIDIEYDLDGYVNAISFEPTVNIKVQDVIHKYGTPNVVEVLYDPLSTPEHNYFDMSLYYDELRTNIKLNRQDNWPAYSLAEDTLVNRIIYYDENSYINSKTSNPHILDWKGFGLYQDPNP